MKLQQAFKSVKRMTIARSRSCLQGGVRRLVSLSLCLSVAVLPPAAQAAAWSGIIDPSRAIDWSAAGVPGGIPTNRTQCGATIGQTNDASVIQNALNSCGPNQFVKLGAGTFNLTSGVNVTVNNTTLRGSGPDQTKLSWTNSTGCATLFALLGLGACADSGNQWTINQFVNT